MEIKEGMYFRTNTGIRRVVYINDGCITFDDFMGNGTSLFNFIEEKELDTYLTKEPSHNIIDLIEVGDYVNGYKVSLKGYDYAHFVQCDYPVENGTTNHYKFYKQAIKSIVTKEQFESVEYKVGE